MEEISMTLKEPYMSAQGNLTKISWYITAKNGCQNSFSGVKSTSQSFVQRNYNSSDPASSS